MLALNSNFGWFNPVKSPCLDGSGSIFIHSYRWKPMMPWGPMSISSRKNKKDTEEEVPSTSTAPPAKKPRGSSAVDVHLENLSKLKTEEEKETWDTWGDGGGMRWVRIWDDVGYYNLFWPWDVDVLRHIEALVFIHELHMDLEICMGYMSVDGWKHVRRPWM